MVSLSVDDIALRKYIQLKRNGEIVGYPDLGIDTVDLEGGQTETPASYVMVLMVTALNDSWKIPIAYFVIDDKFSGKGIITYHYFTGLWKHLHIRMEFKWDDFAYKVLCSTP